MQIAGEKGGTDFPPSFGVRVCCCYVMPPIRSQMIPITRLRRRQDFLRVARKGRNSAVPGLVLQTLNWQSFNPTVPPGVRIGFTVTKKVGNAVKRNRTRRRLKAAAFEVIKNHARENIDYVLIGRTSTLKRPFTLLIEDLETAMQKLNAYRG